MQTNSRELAAHHARGLMGDARVVAFLKSGVKTVMYRDWDVWEADDTLGPGQPLDEMFYTGDRFGYVLSAELLGEETYRVTFGTYHGPGFGSVRIYDVNFETDSVKSMRKVRQWIS